MQPISTGSAFYLKTITWQPDIFVKFLLNNFNVVQLKRVKRDRTRLRVFQQKSLKIGR